jgi:hypothetical protein
MLTRPLVPCLALILAASTGSCKPDRSKPRRGAADAAVEASGKAPIATGGAETPAGPGADGGAARAAADPSGDKPGGAAADPSGDKPGDKPGAEPAAKEAPPSGGDGKPSNLKVLSRRWSMDKVNDYMKKTVSRGLGVKCDHCHEKGDFASDDIKAKAQARAMIQMTDRLNKQFFRGKKTLSCFTCHQGKQKPAATQP